MHDLWLPGGVRTEIRLTAQDTAGAFCLLVEEAPPGWALPPHRHLVESETVHVTLGTMWLALDGEDERMEVPQGSTVHVPPGLVHAMGTLGDEPLERVVLFSPAGIEELFRALGRPAREDPEIDGAALVQLAGEYGLEFGVPED